MSADAMLQGYCVRCHEMRKIESGNFCPVCASVLMDLHEVLAEETRVGAGSVPAATPDSAREVTGSGFAPLAAPNAAGPLGSAVPPVGRTVPAAPAAEPGPKRGIMIALLVATAAVLGIVAAVFLLTRDGGSDETVSPTSPSAVNAPAAAEAPATIPAANNPSVTSPSVIASPATVPAGVTPVVTAAPGTGGGGGVVIVGSNAFAEDSSLSIDGESRTLYVVAELRNDGPDTVQVGEISVTIRDAAGTEIGHREDYPIDRVLDPGETTYLFEFTPSMTYWETETNTFPEGWASFDLAYDVESPYGAEEWDEVNLVTEQVVVERSGANVVATGLLRNTTTAAVDSYAELYVALYDADGRLINVGWTYASPGDIGELQPGESMQFEVEVRNGPTDYATAVVGAVSTPTL